jgi:molybdate transport system permease protein
MVAITSLFVLFLLLPLVALVWRAIDRASFWRYLNDRMVVEALKLSFTTTLMTLVIAFVVGTPAAYLLARWRFRGYRVIETLIDLPIVLPPVVAGVALLMAFGRRGLLGSELDAFGISLPFTTLGVVIAQVFVAAPFYVRSARAGFATIPRDVEDAAQVDGATSWQVLLNVSVPAALPAITAGAVLCWSRALSEFGATLLFAGNLEGKTQTMPLAIMTAFESNLGSALAIAVILLLISSLILFVSRLVMSDAEGFW